MSPNTVDWETIADQVRQRKCTPVIGNYLIGQLVFGDANMSETWAQHEGYPLASSRGLTRVAQYLSFTRGDALRAKRSYLRFLKEKILEQAERSPDANADYLEQVKREARDLTFSQLACDRLRRPNFKHDIDNPLSILAALDIPVYLTTSPHRVIESALSAWGKTSRSEVYAWREDLEEALPAEILIFSGARRRNFCRRSGRRWRRGDERRPGPRRNVACQPLCGSAHL